MGSGNRDRRTRAYGRTTSGRATAVSLVAALLLALAAAPTEAAFPGRNGQIAFSQLVAFETPGTSFIEVVRADGSGRRRLAACPTGVTCRATQPAFSPGGTTIVFASGIDRSNAIGLVRVDGSLLRRLPQLTDQDVQPAWSPDRAQLVFSGPQDGGPLFDIFTTPVASPQARRLTLRPGTDDGEPAWSTRGRIVFRRARDLYTMLPNGQALDRLTFRGGADAAWSPHATKLAFERGADVYIVGADGRGLRRLTFRGGADPAWSPDGRLIAFARLESSASGQQSSIYTVGADGRGLRRVASVPTGGGRDLADPDWQPLP